MLIRLIRDHGVRAGLDAWWWDLRKCAPTRWRESFWRRLANGAPKPLVYFCTIRSYAEAWAEDGKKTPDELTFSEVVKPWGPIR